LRLELEACDHPWKIVPLALIRFQMRRLLGVTAPPSTAAKNRMGLPINLFDAMRCVLRNPEIPQA